MKSTWGKRGMILEKFGWTWDYLNWGIPFVAIQRIMSDLPWYDYGKQEKTGDHKRTETKLTTENIDSVIAQFNSLPR